MIKLIRHSAEFGVSLQYSDYFPKQKRNIFLYVEHYNTDEFIEKTERYIFGEFIRLQLDKNSPEDFKSILQEFFIKLNWQLYSLFGQRPDLERGLSLALTITEGDKLYFVSYGRYSAGMICEDKLEKINEWKNPAQLSFDAIGLLGSHEGDIGFRLYEITLPGNSYFLVINSLAALSLEKLGIHSLSINEHLSQLQLEKKFSYLLLNNCECKAHRINVWLRKKRINRTAIILLIILIISAVYSFWGTNILDDLLARFKFQSREFTRNELKEQFILLQEQAQDLLSQISQQDMQLALIPQQKLKLEKAWRIELPEMISVSPVFDNYRIYLAGGNRVFAIDKTRHLLVWQEDFNEAVEVLRMVDANRILVALQNGNVICLNRDTGKKQWEADFALEIEDDNNLNLHQISLDQYRQLDESIFCIYKGSLVSLGLIRTGEIIAEYDAAYTIDRISRYDLLDKCLYLVQDKVLTKLNIKVIL